MNSGAARLAEAIRADEGLARVMSQVFSAENRSALSAADAQLRSFADQLRAAWAPLLDGLRPLAQNIAAVLSVPRAGDYEALLIELGCEPFEARFLSTWVITSGGRSAQDLDGRRRELGSALLQIVKAADRSTLVMARRAAVLQPMLDEWTRPWIEDGLDACGVQLSFEGFQDLVRDAAARQPAACARLGKVAGLIFGHVPKARGASLSTETVTHALLLAVVHDTGHRAAYTYSPCEDDYTDRLTAATRRQLQQPGFNPVAARRLAKKLKWIEN
jgi:hypothetical protein